MKKEKVAFGFIVNFDNEEIYFSKIFMNAAKDMGSGEFQMLMDLQKMFPTFKRVVNK